MSFASRLIDIHGSKMHYLEQGVGDPILFLHGMPTSSYLWRKVIPMLAPLGRCIALDLIGMGKSDKTNIDYSFLDHLNYVETFIEALNLKNLTIVMHGWGSIIGFDYAMRHEDNCRGLVFYESYLCPMIDDYVSLPVQEQILSLEKQVTALDSPSVAFADTMMRQGFMDRLSEEQIAPYSQPFSQKGSDKPLTQYIKEMSHNEKLNNFIASYSEKLTHSKLSKLMLYSVPGFLTTMSSVRWAKKNLSHLEMIDVGEELHYIQESNPTLMGEAISVWLQGVEQMVSEKIEG